MNHLAEVWFEYMTTLLWQSSLLMLVTGGLYLLSWKRSAAFRYALLCLILVKFLLPTSLESVHGLWSWISVPTQMPVTSFQEIVERMPFTGGNEPVLVEVTKTTAPIPAPTPPRQTLFEKPILVLFILWLSGVLLLASALLFRAFQIKRHFSRAQRVEDPVVLNLLDRCRQEIGIKRTIPLLKLPDLTSPVLVGIIHPRILVTTAAIEGMDLDHLRPIFLHELAHVSRGDLVVNTLQMVLQVLWFFHPGLWLTNWSIRREREIACDDVVLSHMEGSREVYAGSILKVLRQASITGRLGMGLLGIAERGSTAGRRIRRILDQKTRVTRCLSLTVIILLVGLSIILLPSAISQKEGGTGDSSADADKILQDLQSKIPETFDITYIYFRRPFISAPPVHGDLKEEEALARFQEDSKKSLEKKKDILDENKGVKILFQKQRVRFDANLTGINARFDVLEDYGCPLDPEDTTAAEIAKLSRTDICFTGKKIFIDLSPSSRMGVILPNGFAYTNINYLSRPEFCTFLKYLHPNTSPQFEVQRNTKSILLRFIPNPMKIHECEIDQEGGLHLLSEKTTTQGKNTFTKILGDYTLKDGYWIPQRISIYRPQEEEQIEISNVSVKAVTDDSVFDYRKVASDGWTIADGREGPPKTIRVKRDVVLPEVIGKREPRSNEPEVKKPIIIADQKAALSDFLTKIQSSYANQRALFKSMKFKARWTTLPKWSFPQHLLCFQEPETILSGIETVENAQGVIDQEYQIDSQGRYLFSHNIDSILLEAETHPPTPFAQFSYDGQEYRRGSQNSISLYSKERQPAWDYPQTAPTLFMDHLFNTDLQEALAHPSLLSVTQETDGFWHLAFSSAASGKHYHAWSNLAGDYLITRVISKNSAGKVLNRQMDYKKTSGGFWYPTTATLFTNPQCPVSVEIQEFVLNGQEPSFRLEIQPGDEVTDYRKSLDVPDVYIEGTKRKTYDEVLDGTLPYIAGVVTDTSGVPIHGARVSIDGQKITFMKDNRPGHTHRDYYKTMLAWTDAQGRFAIPIEEKRENPKPDSIKETGEYYLMILSDTHSDVTTNSIPTGTQDVKVTMSPLGTLSGRVVRMENGSRVPVTGVNVDMERLGIDFFSGVNTRIKETTSTGAHGEFLFGGIHTSIELDESARDHIHVDRKLTCQGMVTYVAFWNGEFRKEVEIVLPDAAGVTASGNMETHPHLAIRPLAYSETGKQTELVPYHLPDMNRGGYVASVLNDVVLTETDLINPSKDGVFSGYFWVKDDSAKRVKGWKENPTYLAIILDGEILGTGAWNDLFKPASFLGSDPMTEPPHQLLFYPGIHGGGDTSEEFAGTLTKLVNLDIPAE